MPLGQEGESLATAHLKKKGWLILDRNIREKFGEIDILTRTPKGVLVFMEVKTLRSAGEGLKPEDNLTNSKLKKMRKMAEAFANGNPGLIRTGGWRIDALTIEIDAEGNSRINHYTNL